MIWKQIGSAVSNYSANLRGSMCAQPKIWQKPPGTSAFCLDEFSFAFLAYLSFAPLFRRWSFPAYFSAISYLLTSLIFIRCFIFIRFLSDVLLNTAAAKSWDNIVAKQIRNETIMYTCKCRGSHKTIKLGQYFPILNV